MHFHPHTKKPAPCEGNGLYGVFPLVFVQSLQIRDIMLHVGVVVDDVLHVALNHVDSPIVELVVSLIQLNVQTLVELVFVASAWH